MSAALEAALGSRPAAAGRVTGGDINDAFRVDTADGERVFVKTRAGAGEGEYEAEAAGLRWLAAGPANLPAVRAVGEGRGEAAAFLALEWVEPGSLSAGGAEAFGRDLAMTHELGAPAHMWLPGRFARQRIGSLALPTEQAAAWPPAYAEQRLLPLARMASEAGSLSGTGRRAVEAVGERIEELAGPPEPPARLHGDLWAGNVHAGRSGGAWLIDPSAQGGHREMDLAMLRLFGAPSERIFAAYEEAFPLAEGAAGRVGLWQLQPLLVHAVLFGGHYGGAAERAAAAYL